MSKNVQYLAGLLKQLHSRWSPHPHQKPILHSLFGLGTLMIMVECGRKFGKTEIDCYTLWRWAAIKPGEYYMFLPYQNQAREILWSPGRLQEFGPTSWIQKINDTEMRITFKNGSFIKVDGSDNFNKYRGPNPHGAVYDEFRDFRPEFHAAFGPNLASHRAPLLINGTPPETHVDQYYGIMNMLRKRQHSYFNYPSWANPHIDREWLRNEKEQLYLRGEGDVWEREYGARHVRGGANSIFPMFRREKHVFPHEDILAEVGRDLGKMEFAITADPGNATVFSVLYLGWNPYTKMLYIFKEIYEKEQKNTSTSKIVPRIKAVRENLFEKYQPEWLQVYDEAATWFATEALNSFGENWIPTSKARNKKEDGLSLIKDLMLLNRVKISDKCLNLIWEVESYIRDKNGRIPKANDHAIDCLRYGLPILGVDLVGTEEMVKVDRNRYYTPEEDVEMNNDSVVTPYDVEDGIYDRL